MKPTIFINNTISFFFIFKIALKEASSYSYFPFRFKYPSLWINIC